MSSGNTEAFGLSASLGDLIVLRAMLTDMPRRKRRARLPPTPTNRQCAWIGLG